VGHEFGVTTGRKRRCGWLDIPLLRFSHMVGRSSPLSVRVARFFLGATYQNGEKFAKWPQNVPNNHVAYRMVTNNRNGHKIYQHCLFQGPPKYAQNRDLWFDNIPSGNTAFYRSIYTNSGFCVTPC
jgi:hypothetical protein